MALRMAIAVGMAIMSLNGCGRTSSEVTPDVPAPSPETVSKDKKDVYVVLRMDDIAVRDTDDQVDILHWAVDNRVAMTFGMIASEWPPDCLDQSSGKNCSKKIVRAVSDAYHHGHILKKGGDGFIEIASHSWGHEAWPKKYKDKDWVKRDFEASKKIFDRAFPDAKVKTFIAPDAMANHDTFDVMRDHDFDIISAQGQMGCDNDRYIYAPCTQGKDRDKGQCIPPHDEYFSEDGINKIHDVISLPAGSANSDMSETRVGQSVHDTIGEDACGCRGDRKCSLIPNARRNAKKSHGLWWTVLMMHPSTKFDGKSYKHWLDDFLSKVKDLDDYNVHFVTFQDLAKMKPSSKTFSNTTLIL